MIRSSRPAPAILPIRRSFRQMMSARLDVTHFSPAFTIPREWRVSVNCSTHPGFRMNWSSWNITDRTPYFSISISSSATTFFTLRPRMIGFRVPSGDGRVYTWCSPGPQQNVHW